MVNFEDARKIIDSKYDIVKDLDDAWLFTWRGAENLIGGDQGYVVMKETGEIILPYTYYLGDSAIEIE